MRAVDQQHWPTPEELMEYVDGEGMPATRREIESHLAGCAACRGIVDEQHGLTQRMQAWTTDWRARDRCSRRRARHHGGMAGAGSRRAVMVSFSAAAVILVVISMNIGTLKQRPAATPVSVAESRTARRKPMRRKNPRPESHWPAVPVIRRVPPLAQPRDGLDHPDRHNSHRRQGLQRRVRPGGRIDCLVSRGVPRSHDCDG